VEGASFSAAPVLDPGTYRDTLRAADEEFYRFPVRYGQSGRLSATLQPDAAADREIGPTLAQVIAFAPDREGMLLATDPRRDVSSAVTYDGSRAVTITAAIPQVRFRNRGSGDRYAESARLGATTTWQSSCPGPHASPFPSRSRSRCTASRTVGHGSPARSADRAGPAL